MLKRGRIPYVDKAGIIYVPADWHLEPVEMTFVGGEVEYARGATG
jgi:hypothetical protein